MKLYALLGVWFGAVAVGFVLFVWSLAAVSPSELVLVPSPVTTAPTTPRAVATTPTTEAPPVFSVLLAPSIRRLPPPIPTTTTEATNEPTTTTPTTTTTHRTAPAPPVITTEPAPTPTAPPITRTLAEQDAVWLAAYLDAGGPPEIVDALLTVVLPCESDSHNDVGDLHLGGSHGRAQIFAPVWAARFEELFGVPFLPNIYDPAFNGAMAAHIANVQGITAWSCYPNG